MEEEKMDKKQKKISDLEQRAKEKIFEKAQIKVVKKWLHLNSTIKLSMGL